MHDTFVHVVYIESISQRIEAIIENNECLTEFWFIYRYFIT